MRSSHHICAPLLSVAQQSSVRDVFIDVGAIPSPNPVTATGADVTRRVTLLSHAISTCMCISPGSIVMLAAHTSGAMMESLLAALDAGCIVCPVNWRWTPSELAEAMGRLAPALVMYDSSCALLAQEAAAAAAAAAAVEGPTTQQIIMEPPPRMCLIDHWEPGVSVPGLRLQVSGPRAGDVSSFLSPSRATDQTASTSELLLEAASSLAPSSTPNPPAPISHPRPSPTPSNPIPPLHATSQPHPTPARGAQPPLQLLSAPCGTALLVFTSGTTAAPKGVRLSHAAFHAQSLVKLALVGYCPADTYLHLAPLFHIGGLSSAFAALQAGAAHVFLPRFDPRVALDAIARHRVTAFIAVPTMLQDLAAAAATAAGTAAAGPTAAGPWVGSHGKAGGLGASGSGLCGSGLGLGCVRRILVGAGGTSAALQDAVSRTFPRADLLSAYGMTEACSSMTFRHLRSGATAAASASASTSSSSPASSLDAQQPAQLHQWAPPPLSPQQQPHCSGLLADPAGPSDPGVCVGWPAPGVQLMVVRSAALEETGQQPASGLRSSDGAAVAGVRSSSGSNGSGGVAGVCTATRLAGMRQPRAPGSGCIVREAAPPGVVGEVLTRGPHVMLGYWQDTAATAEALTADGWLRTGDLGYMAADGSLWLLGRAKDMIKSGGENVFAPQVEAALCSHPAVSAAAVVGLPDQRLGEQVAVLLVLREGWAFDGPCLAGPVDAPPPAPHLASACANGGVSVSGSDSGGQAPSPLRRRTSLADLQAHCRARGLAGFRLPRFAAAQWSPLPVNGSGKVQKPAVRALLGTLRAEGGVCASGSGTREASVTRAVVDLRSKL